MRRDKLSRHPPEVFKPRDKWKFIRGANQRARIDKNTFPMMHLATSSPQYGNEME